MGIIRKLGFVLLLLCAFNLSAQITYDTIYFSEKKFVEHVVKGGQSLRSIAKLHRVKISDIKASNELERRLFYNQLLYIPIYLNNKEEVATSVKELISREVMIDDSIVNIALLMPYSLHKKDTLYYNRSESALSFHIGVELALDSLRRIGKNIVLHTFDTEQDSLVVKRIVYSNKLNDMDIIIGPMYSKLFEIVCRKFGFDNTKIIISPLSRDSRKIKDYSSVYQIALTYKIQADILTEYLIKNKLDQKIIILNDKKEEGLAAYLRYKFKKHQKIVKSYEITNIQVDSIARYFQQNQNVLLLSKDKSFISNMFALSDVFDSVSTVFAFESIISYENLDINNLMQLDVHVPHTRGVDSANDYDLHFISLFEAEFQTNVAKYSKEGYDIIMHFCGSSDLYDFKQLRGGYYENISAPIYHYLDYELVPAD